MITFLELGRYGRLGNQLWQIASTIGIAKRHLSSYAFPEWEYNKYFGSKLPYLSDVFGFNTLSYYQERSPYYSPINIDTHHNWNLSGYFQSPKYFEEYEPEIKELFNLDSYMKRTQINYVSVHVRRGDYKHLKHIHTNLDETDYYKKAMDLFPEDKFLVFSDDIDWCLENFKGDRIRIWTYQGEMDSLSFMSACKHHIIANSSFSWWAAYLGINPDRRIIYPSKWVETESRNDRIPDNKSWERIEL